MNAVKGNDSMHETQRPAELKDSRAGQQVIHDDLLPIQRIEGAGPPQKVDFQTLPAPIKAIGYVFGGIVLLFGGLSLLVTFIR